MISITKLKNNQTLLIL